MQSPWQPQHVAIIMDGNGRWAEQRGLPRTAGHEAGAKSAQAAIHYAKQAGIKHLTLFAFSTENWQRPHTEVSFLFKMLSKALQKQSRMLEKEGIALDVIGDMTALPVLLQRHLQRLMLKSKQISHPTLTVHLALNYGGRWDILQAAQKAVKAQADLKSPEDFERYLSLSGVPDPDVMIRTSNEQRLSNFLLWQLAYTELIFMPVLWPDFQAEHFEAALQTAQQRSRRFGGLTALSQSPTMELK